MPTAEKEELAQADQRWLAFEDPILDHRDSNANAVRLVYQRVPGPGDDATEARSLENAGLLFHEAMRRFPEHMAQINGMSASSQSTEGLNDGTRLFVGQGP
jgi:hypothetical protein